MRGQALNELSGLIGQFYGHNDIEIKNIYLRLIDKAKVISVKQLLVLQQGILGYKR
jgi:hypothetical protein